jgi:single-strand DNA-binding protein
MTDETPAPPAPTNLVHLTGRISADPETRVLPSGDELVSFRLVVRRDAAALRRSVTRLTAGAHVEVQGQLRRRFTSGGQGTASWVSVEVDSCRRVRPPAVASDA